MPDFTHYYNNIDKLLVERGHSKLTDKEKNLLEINWRQGCINWITSPKATNSEYALNRQLELVFCNILYDVLNQTRGYGTKKDE